MQKKTNLQIITLQEYLEEAVGSSTRRQMLYHVRNLETL
jgi:hypothetical protein